MKVLIAHREASTRDQIRGWLEPLGWVVRDAETVPEALHTCTRWHPDVALVDGSLTSSDGETLLSEIKSLSTGAFSTAVVVMAPQLCLDDAVAELQRGAHDFLLEPVQPAELVARVRAAARTKSLQEELLGQAQRLEQMIFEDTLTGLFNRRAVLTQLDALLSGAQRHGRPLSVAILDIDHFKAFNDSHGHHIGDRVLIGVSDTLRDRLRGEDWLGRLGGEELLAILPDTGPEDAERVCEDLRAAISELTIDHEGTPLNVTVSIGWATWEGEARELLVKRADHALYAAKGAGRNAVKGAPQGRGAATLRGRS